jgi:hypothetical protein
MKPERLAGLILLAVGTILVFAIGHNYGACHQWWADGSQPACMIANRAHLWGIVAMIAGGFLLAFGFARDHI